MSERQIIEPWPSHQAGRTYSSAARKGPFLFVSGINSTDEYGAVRGTTMAEQAEVIYQKIDVILRAAGAHWSDVVKTTDYITDRAGYRETAAVRRRYLGPEFPAATGIIVKELIGRGVKIEIDAMAVLGESTDSSADCLPQGRGHVG